MQLSAAVSGQTLRVVRCNLDMLDLWRFMVGWGEARTRRARLESRESQGSQGNPESMAGVTPMTALQGDARHIPLADGTFVEKRHHGLQRISKL